MDMSYFVYLLASDKKGTLYIGVTNNLERRVLEHKAKVHKGFTEKYDVNKLVWFEELSDISVAIETEKRMKGWRRAWKIELIEKNNPKWKDLYPEVN